MLLQIARFQVLWLSNIPLGFPCSSFSKESACSSADPGSVPWLGRSPGEGNGNTLQYPCLKNLMDSGALWAVVHGITKSQARLSDQRLLYSVEFCTVKYTKAHRLAWDVPMTMCVRSVNKLIWLHVQMHFYMFESFQLGGLFVTDLLHRCSVNVCNEWTREECKELPVLSIFACIMTTLNRNSIEHNWGLM